VAARPIDPYGAEYAYVQVADDIARRIADGEITAKLPSEQSLAEEYGGGLHHGAPCDGTAPRPWRDHHGSWQGNVRNPSS
jgi:hypothetical protein